MIKMSCKIPKRCTKCFSGVELPVWCTVGVLKRGVLLFISQKVFLSVLINIKFTHDFDNYFRFFVTPFCYASSSFFIISTGVFAGFETPGK